MKPRTKARSALELVKATFRQWMDDDALRLGASLAFYTVWSIGPLLLVVISVAGLAFGRQAAQGEVVATLSGLVGDPGAHAIEDTIVNANASGHTVLANVVGIVMLLVAASGVFAELKSSLNAVWNVAPKPGSFWLTIKSRFLSLTMVLGTGFLLLVALLISAAIAAVAGRIHGLLPGGETVWHVAHFALALGITALLFALMFKVIPDAEVAWRDVWLGGLVTALLFTVGQVLIGVYFGHTNIGTAYGAASSLMIILVWVFFSSCILLLGAEFTRAYANMYGSKIKPAPNAIEVPDGMTSAAAAHLAEKRAREEAEGKGSAAPIAARQPTLTPRRLDEPLRPSLVSRR